jgi:hypothetical protein
VRQIKIGLGTLFDYDAYIISYVGDEEDLLTLYQIYLLCTFLRPC